MDRGIGTTHLAESLQAFAEQEAGDRSSGVAESEILSALKNPELLNSCNSCLLSSVIHLESKPEARLHNRVLFTESVNLWFIGSLNDADAPNACRVTHRAFAACDLQLFLRDPVLLLKMAARTKERQPPMLEQDNIDLIKKLYAAFGKGDIETIVDHLAD